MREFKRQSKTERAGFGNRGRAERPTLYETVCSNCGKTCEVPFRPTGSKPIYCRDCFQKTGPTAGRPEGRQFERSSSNDRQLYDAICSNCGDTCKIPFQPRDGRPVFCSRCFERNEGSESKSSDRPRFGNRNDSRTRTSEQPNYNTQFEALNAKMDKILAILAPSVTQTAPVLESTIDEAIIDELVEEAIEDKPARNASHSDAGRPKKAKAPAKTKTGVKTKPGKKKASPKSSVSPRKKAQ